MNNEIKVEEWNGYNIRFVLYEGKWWAVAKDVTDALGLGNPTKALYGIAGSEITLADLTNSKGSSPGSRKTQRMNVITTKAITKLAFRSRKKEAEEFQDWVCDVVEYLREQAGLEAYEYFMTWDREFQKAQMTRLHDGLPLATTADYCKANRITNKAVSNVFGFEKSISKDDMTPEMLKLRQKVLNYTIDLIIAKERFGLDLSVSENVYAKTYEWFTNKDY